MWPVWLLLVFGKHEFDWDSTSCWSVRWLGASGFVFVIARQQIQNPSRRFGKPPGPQHGMESVGSPSTSSLSKPQQSEETSLAGQQIENTSSRSFFGIWVVWQNSAWATMAWRRLKRGVFRALGKSVKLISATTAWAVFQMEFSKMLAMMPVPIVL